MIEIQTKYKQAIASFLGVDSTSIFLYWKGRIALYAALKALGVGKKDEVIIPAFTCVVVPNAIIYLGAKPIYTDVDLSSMCATRESIEAKITDRTKVIIIQNMLGLSNEVEEIIEMAKAKGIHCVEDCTHGFGGSYNEKPNGTLSDMSFYSTQWNKPFSTGVGGILSVNNPDLLEKIQNINNELITPSFKTRFSLATLIKIKKYILNDSTYWFLIRLYRKLSKMGLVIGSSNKDEITGINQPENYFMASGNIQAETGISELKKLKEKIEERIHNGLIYNDYFIKNKFFHFKDDLIKNHSFLKFPILVKDRKKFMENAEKAKIRLGDWFISPIHPVEQGFENWQLQIEEFPNAHFLTKHIVNLPTDEIDITKVMSFLELNKDQLLEL
jgi:dTDP-4-amino-4,6-dideoxygalactose transaminase